MFNAKASLVKSISTAALVTLGVFALATSNTAFSEIVALPGSNTYKVQDEGVTKPRRSSTKAQVLQQFGEPLSKHGPKGEPAIYYWEYPQYTVYFENNHVLHSVNK